MSAESAVPSTDKVISDTKKAVAERIKAKRAENDITQDGLAKYLGVSRTAITQWEKGLTMPSFEKTLIMARVLRTTPEFIAFGVEGRGKKEDQDTVQVEEVIWGETPDQYHHVASWALPKDFSRADRHAEDDALKIVTIETEAFLPRITPGDKLLIDTSVNKIGAESYYMIWNGVTATLAHIMIVPGAKPTARVAYAAGAGVDPSKVFEVALDDLVVLGRVKRRFTTL